MLSAFRLLVRRLLLACGHATAAKLHVGSAIIATTDARFLSFNIDMAEVTGVAAGTGKPLDLSNPLLSQRIDDLVPAYLRIGGGSQACLTYYLTHNARSGWWPVTSPYCMGKG